MNRYERMNQERKIVDVRKRVAAYCRVSTDHEDQANSFESQQRYFRQYIRDVPQLRTSHRQAILHAMCSFCLIFSPDMPLRLRSLSSSPLPLVHRSSDAC